MCDNCKCNNEYDLEVKFAKVNPDAIIPSKRDENAGWDLYLCFEENEVRVNPGEMEMIDTGIATAFPYDWQATIKERGSTASKLIAIRAGLVEGSFRDSWKVMLNNTGNKVLIITKDEELSRKAITDKVMKEAGYEENQLKVLEENNSFENWINDNFVFYPYKKAIAQFVFLPVPKVKDTEVSYEELLKIKSNRGTGMCGSTGK